MNVRILCPLFVLLTAQMLAQAPDAPAAAPGPQQFGFSFHIPAGWSAIDAQSTLPEVKERQLASAKTDEEKKEIACVEIPVSARKGPPPSFLATMALPFACVGQALTEKDLPEFAEGSSQGPRAVFDFGEPEYGEYLLGSHKIWIERAKGSPKGHPEMPYTMEIACSLLKEAAVCWMNVAADAQALREFESNAVTLDGDFFAEFIPATAFDKKPGS
jgi:hypothetical protein